MPSEAVGLILEFRGKAGDKLVLALDAIPENRTIWVRFVKLGGPYPQDTGTWPPEQCLSFGSQDSEPEGRCEIPFDSDATILVEYPWLGQLYNARIERVDSEGKRHPHDAIRQTWEGIDASRSSLAE